MNGTFCRIFAVLLLLPAGGCDEAPGTGYFPTTPGHEWTYDIRRTDPETLEPVTQKSIVRNLPTETIDDAPHYPKRYANGNKRLFVETADGVGVRAPSGDGYSRLIAYPPTVGTTWRTASRLHLFDLPKRLKSSWEKISRDLVLNYSIASLDDAVAAPAGRFTDCLRVDAVGFLDLPRRYSLGIKTIKVEQSQWYAPGVGLVRMTRKEYALPNLYPAEYLQELTSFTPR